MNHLKARVVSFLKEAGRLAATLLWTLFSLAAAIEIAYPLRHHHGIAIAVGVWMFGAIAMAGFTAVRAYEDYRSNRIGSISGWRIFYGGVFVIMLLWPLPIALFLGLAAAMLAGAVLMLGLAAALLIPGLITIIVLRLFGVDPMRYIIKRRLEAAVKFREYVRGQLARGAPIETVDQLQDQLLKLDDEIHAHERRLGIKDAEL